MATNVRVHSFSRTLCDNRRNL